MADEHKQKAAEAAQEFVKYLVVLSVGGLGFALSRLGTVPGGMRLAKYLAVGSGAILSLSVFFGILAHGALVSQMYNNAIDLEGSPLAAYARTQWILFFAGIVVLGGAILVPVFAV